MGVIAPIETVDLSLPPNPGDIDVIPGRIGLCWAGSKGHENDRLRSAKLADFQSVIDFATANGLEVQSLQYGVAVDPPLLPCPTGDFYDSACAVASCELVITVDTSIAHIAGTLGRPVWVLLPINGEWRWMNRRTDSPWYPSMTLFRQTKSGDWSDVVARIVDSLSRGLE